MAHSSIHLSCAKTKSWIEDPRPSNPSGLVLTVPTLASTQQSWNCFKITLLFFCNIISPSTCQCVTLCETVNPRGNDESIWKHYSDGGKKKKKEKHKTLSLAHQLLFLALLLSLRVITALTVKHISTETPNKSTFSRKAKIRHGPWLCTLKLRQVVHVQ